MSKTVNQIETVRLRLSKRGGGESNPVGITALYHQILKQERKR